MAFIIKYKTKDGQRLYLKEMVAIGPRFTEDVNEALCFRSRAEADALLPTHIAFATCSIAPLPGSKHRVFQGMLSKKWFFAPCVREDKNGLNVVIGRKYDITDDLQPYLLKRYRRKA